MYTADDFWQQFPPIMMDGRESTGDGPPSLECKRNDYFSLHLDLFRHSTLSVCGNRYSSREKEGVLSWYRHRVQSSAAYHDQARETVSVWKLTMANYGKYCIPPCSKTYNNIRTFLIGSLFESIDERFVTSAVSHFAEWYITGLELPDFTP